MYSLHYLPYGVDWGSGMYIDLSWFDVFLEVVVGAMHYKV